MLPEIESIDNPKTTHTGLEEPSRKRDAPSDDMLQNSLTTEEISHTSSTLLAWSTWNHNKINVVQLETKQEFVNFDGVSLSDVDEDCESWSHVKDIANTRLLVSVHHCYGSTANLAVFDVSRKGQARKIYLFEEVSGQSGYGDLTYNPRRRILGAISIGGKIAYHLYDFTIGKTGDIVTLIRKTKWHPQNSSGDNNHITGLDFNLNGEIAASIDKYGACLISDVSTGEYRYHLNLEQKFDLGDSFNRCRWSTNTGESSLYVKYDLKKLNVLDAEKKALTLKNSIQIESDGGDSHWIDVCQNNGNLLASCGLDEDVKIFDKRESKIVQTFNGIHENSITCVRWSPSGDMLASASYDMTVALLDFKTGKLLYTGNTSDESLAMSVCFV